MDIRCSATELELEANPFPYLKTIHDYWIKLCKRRFAPARLDFDPAMVMPYALSRIALVNVHHDPLAFTYRLFGTAVVDAYGSDLTGQSVKALEPESFATEVWREYAETVERRAPGLYLLQFPSSSGVWHPQATLKLPFSSDGETVDLVMSINEYGSAEGPPNMCFQDTYRTIAEAVTV